MSCRHAVHRLRTRRPKEEQCISPAEGAETQPLRWMRSAIGDGGSSKSIFTLRRYRRACGLPVASCERRLFFKIVFDGREGLTHINRARAARYAETRFGIATDEDIAPRAVPVERDNTVEHVLSSCARCHHMDERTDFRRVGTVYAALQPSTGRAHSAPLAGCDGLRPLVAASHCSPGNCCCRAIAYKLSRPTPIRVIGLQMARISYTLLRILISCVLSSHHMATTNLA